MKHAMTDRIARGFLMGLLVVVVVVTTMWMMTISNPAVAQSRQPKIPEHFKSGGERSLAILHEISNTLKQIDMRLQRIEQSSTTTKQIDARLQRIEQVLVRAADRARRVSSSGVDGER